MALYVKPNGTEIEVNDNEDTVEYVKSLGWKLKQEPKKRGPKPKAKLVEE